MPRQAGAIVLVLGGVGLIYLGATGYLDSAWRGLRGQCGAAASAADAKPTPTKAGQAGGVSRALGRGRGGQVSNVPVIDRGIYYPSPTGALMASDMGVW